MDDNCGEWVECMGVASGCGEQEVGVASGSGWNLWVWLLGVVLRRYIDFLIVLIPTPLISVLFCSSIPTFLFIFKMFSFFNYIHVVHVIITFCGFKILHFALLETRCERVRVCTRRYPVTLTDCKFVDCHLSQPLFKEWLCKICFYFYIVIHYILLCIECDMMNMVH